MDIFEQCFGQWWQNGVDVFVSVLFDFVCDIFCSVQCIFEEVNLYVQIVQVNVQSGVGVSECIQWYVFVYFVDFFVQFEIVFILVEDYVVQMRVVFNKF